jgi:8-oxo-dGTP pyrophosphatase MutT (NUDIX family)
MNLGCVADYDPVDRDAADAREAAVLVPVVGDRLLFTRRAEDLPDHPGEMSFPGGAHESGDRNLAATALREAEEEVGLRPDEATVVGRLDDVPTVSDYVVRPFVATVPDREYAPDEREVAEITALPVAALADRGNYDAERRGVDGRHVTVHYFRVNGYTVWGATGRVLARLLSLATDWRPP